MPIPRLPVADLIKILLQYQPTPAHMWFLGAGASVSSGVPAGDDIVFEMLAMEYTMKTRAALAGPKSAKERKVRQWAKWNLSWFDPNGTKSEYVQVMENVIRDQAARDRFLENHFKNARPSNGYTSLGKLVKRGAITTVWTTNFDSLVQKSTGDLREPLEIVNTKSQFEVLEPFPARRRLIRLHGDFWHGDLVNTPNEFRDMPEVRYKALRRLLISHGLVVVGYGGRDAELMNALIRAAREENVLRKGLFWCVRRSETPSSFVLKLLRACGGHAYLIEIDGFDELMGEVEEAFSRNQGSPTSIVDDPQSALETQALLATLADELTERRRAKEARDRRRTAVLSLCKLMGAKRAAIIVRLPQGPDRTVHPGVCERGV